MNCEHTQTAIQRALDAGLTQQPPQAAAEHLERCASCRARWEETCAVEAGLSELAAAREIALPAGLHRKIMAALETRSAPEARNTPARRRLGIPMRVGLATAASLLCVALVSLTLVRHSADPLRGLSHPASDFAIPSRLPETSDIDLSAFFGNPKQDVQDLAGSILSVANGLIDLDRPAQPDTRDTPTPTPFASKTFAG